MDDNQERMKALGGLKAITLSSLTTDDIEKKKKKKIQNVDYPSSSCTSWSTTSRSGVWNKVLSYWYTKEQRDAQNIDVSHGITVSKLYECDPNSSCGKRNQFEVGNYKIWIQNQMMNSWQWYHLPTMPNRIQYMAPNMGRGIDAKNAPNFPKASGRQHNQISRDRLGGNFRMQIHQ